MINVSKTNAYKVPTTLKALLEVNTPEYVAMADALFSWQDNLAVNFTHAILGIFTEAEELCHCNKSLDILDESGDLIFYERALQKCLMHYLKELEPDDFYELSDIFGSVDKFVEWASAAPIKAGIDPEVEVLDVCKKWIGYGKVPKAEKMRELLCVVYNLIGCSLANAAEGFYTAEAKGRDKIAVYLTKAQDGNVKKLSTRYKGGVFNAAEAINPDKAAEMAAIKGE